MEVKMKKMKKKKMTKKMGCYNLVGEDGVEPSTKGGGIGEGGFEDIRRKGMGRGI